MSAAAQPNPRRKTQPPPTPQRLRVKRLVASNDDLKKRLESYKRSSWGRTSCAPRRNLPQITRITRGLAQAGFLMLVRDFTDGAPREAGKRPPKFSPPIVPQDACDLLQAFTRQHMLEEMRDLVNRGALETKAGRKWGDVERLTEDDYCFRCAEDRWPELADPKLERKGPGVAEDPDLGVAEDPNSAIDEEEANSVDMEEGYAKSRETAVYRVLVSPTKNFLPVGKIAGRQLLCRNRNSHPITVSASVSGGGDLRVDLLPPPGKGKLMEIPPQESAAAPGVADLPALVVGLVNRGYPVLEPIATQWVEALAGVADEFVWEKFDERTRGKRRVSEKVLLLIAADIAKKWRLHQSVHAAPAQERPKGDYSKPSSCQHCGGSGLVGIDWETIGHAVRAVAEGAQYCACPEGAITRDLVEPALMRRPS